MSTSESENILPFPRDADEEKVRRVMAEACRLARLSAPERTFWTKTSAERLGITREELKALVEAAVKENEKREREEKAEQHRRERRIEKQRIATDRAEERKRERDQKQVVKDAERKAKDKHSALATIAKLPTDQHEAKLAELAKRLGEDLAALRDEFAEYCSAEAPSGGDASEWGDVEPWLEPVATAELLEELVTRINQHIKAKPHEVLAIALWVLMAWAHEAAHYSVYLVATAPKEDCGKSTLIIEVVGRLAPKSYASGSDPTVASIFRTADREKPTMLFDNVDTLFQRKPEVAELFLNGWTRGIKYPRTERIGRHWQTVWYDPFCPKACSLIGTNLPRPLLGRCLLIELWPLKPGEEVVEVKPFDQELMDAFKTLRRKSLRWSNDNVATLKNAEPLFPAGLSTRPRGNAKLLLAIAELGGATWAEPARAALDKLLREKREPSWLELLLQELWTIFVKEGRKDVLSKQLLARLTADPTSEWCEYGHGGHGHKVTEREIAALLRKLHIRPYPIGKNRLRGYHAADFFEKDIFQHFLGCDPLIRSPQRKSSPRKSSPRKSSPRKSSPRKSRR